MVPTRTESGQQTLNALIDIFTTPVNIEGALQSILTDREASATLINRFLKDAMAGGLFPREVVIAQFVGVPPKQHRSYLDLRNLILVRDDYPRSTEMLQGYAFTVGGLKMIDWSFHKAITWDCYGPAGSAIVFALNQAPPRRSLFSQANLFWVDYQLAHPPEMTFLKKMRVDAPGVDWNLKLVPILDDLHNINTIRKAEYPMNVPKIAVFPKARLSAGDRARVVDFLDNNLRTQSNYFRYCLPSVTEGTIVLAAPRPVFFFDHKQHEGVGDSGLAVVFDPKHNVTSDDIERVYCIAQRVNSMFSALYSLAQGQRERGAANAVRLMEHSLGNTLGKLRLIAPIAKPHLELEEAMLKACRTVAGDGVVVFDSFPLAAIQKALLDQKPNIRIDTNAIMGTKMDPRLIAIIIELCRNLDRHSAKMDEGSIQITVNALGCPELRVAGKATVSQARRLLARLKEDWKGVSLRGIPSLVLLASGISNPGATAKWSFGRCDGAEGENKRWLRSIERVELMAAGPEWLFDNTSPPTTRLHFTFELLGLRPQLIHL